MASQASGEENYQPIFYTFCVMRIFCSLLILNLNLSFKKPAKKVFKVMSICQFHFYWFQSQKNGIFNSVCFQNLWRLIIKPHIFLFLVVFFICGSIWGFLEAYLFWFLEDLGSTKLTMGISLAIGNAINRKHMCIKSFFLMWIDFTKIYIHCFIIALYRNCCWNTSYNWKWGYYQKNGVIRSNYEKKKG